MLQKSSAYVQVEFSAIITQWLRPNFHPSTKRQNPDSR